jgi:hypothetical protein
LERKKEGVFSSDVLLYWKVTIPTVRVKETNERDLGQHIGCSSTLEEKEHERKRCIFPCLAAIEDGDLIAPSVYKEKLVAV